VGVVGIHLTSMPQKLGGVANKLATVVSNVDGGGDRQQLDIKWVTCRVCHNPTSTGLERIDWI